MNLIFIGAQGSGKGTQAQRLADLLHLKVCSSGDQLRQAIAQGTPLGTAAQPYVERGELVPDDLIVGLVLECVESLEGRAGVILDGFPRTLEQAKTLDARLADRHLAVTRVIYLDVPRDTLLERLSGRYVCQAAGHVWNINTHPPRQHGICDYDGSPLFQRPDDTTESISRRLDIFYSTTVQLKDYYAQHGKLADVVGTGSIQQVTLRILRVLNLATAQEDGEGTG